MWIGEPQDVDIGADGKPNMPPTRGGHAVPAPDDVGWADSSSGKAGWYVNGRNRIMMRKDVESEIISV